MRASPPSLGSAIVPQKQPTLSCATLPFSLTSIFNYWVLAYLPRLTTLSIAGGVNRLIGAKTYLSSPLPRPSSPPLLQSESISNHRAQFVQSLLDALTTSPQLLLYAYF
ncbi:hypothetical protein ACQRIT_005919 [Beauveria bassiana]